MIQTTASTPFSWPDEAKVCSKSLIGMSSQSENGRPNKASKRLQLPPVITSVP